MDSYSLWKFKGGWTDWKCAASVPISTFMRLWAIYIFPIGLPILLQENMSTDPGNICIAHRLLNEEIATEAAQFLFWESFVAVRADKHI
jgi:hypothetical protein